MRTSKCVDKIKTKGGKNKTMGYIDELQFVVDSTNDIFPEFLFNPLFNEFEGEDYYSLGATVDLRVIEAQKIRRKYRNYFDYVAALESYNEYMNFLIDKYGSLSIIKNSVKVGLFEDFIPPKPKLKTNSQNKEFLRSKIVPSRQINMEFDSSTVREIADSLYPITKSELSNINEDDRFKKPNKKFKKTIKRALEKISGIDRQNNLYRSNSVGNGVDFIIDYMNQANKGFYDDKGKHKEYSITEILKEEERRKGIPYEILDYEETANTSIIVGDRLSSRKEQQRIDIMTDLLKLGINLLDGSKNMDKRVVKMIKRSAGYDDLNDPALMSKKELKQYKKRQKKERVDLDRRKDNDRILTQTLLNNRFDVSSKNNSLSFKLRDLYKDN